VVVANIFYFPFHIWDVILSIEELIFFKMAIAPPARILLTIMNDIITININHRLIEGSLEVKLPTIWTDEKQRWKG